MKLIWPLLLATAASIGHCIEAPQQVAEHSLVRVKTQQDASIWVLTIRSGMIAKVDSYRAPGVLIFTGPPGVYVLLGTEAGQDFQEFVTIGGNSPQPPGPDPPGPDPPKPDPPAPDPPKPPDFTDTTYDVGPQVRWYCVQQGLTKAGAKKAAAAFADASSIAGRVQLPLSNITQRLEAALKAAGWTDSTLIAYGDLFEQRWDEAKFRTLGEHARAFWECAQWLDDDLKDTTPEWINK